VVGRDWRVETLSANAGMLGLIEPGKAVGEALSDVIGSDQTHTLRNRVSWIASDDSEVQDFGVRWGSMTLDVRAARDGHRYLIEAEEAPEPRLPDGIGMVRSMTDRLSGKDPVEMAEQAMRRLQALIGFERAWLCDRRGHRITGGDRPAASAGVEAPRLIADRDGEAVALLGKDHPALLARAAFRAPTKSELAELSSDGAAASMALPIRIDGALVASLHARHSRPRRCGAERRSVAHLFAERLVARMMRQGWSAPA
jgi:light-regulated signal transduction histidine kinase (bacteriophytochrome)